MNYAAQILEDLVIQVIVGHAHWAETHLGGMWIDCDESVGIGWTWNGSSFVPPTFVEDDQNWA